MEKEIIVSLNFRHTAKQGVPMEIRESTINKVKAFVNEADIALLKRLLIEDKWVIGHSWDKEEVESYSNEEIRKLMTSELYENSDYVHDILARVNYYIRKKSRGKEGK